PALIGDYAYRYAFDPPVSGDHLFRVIRLKLVQLTAVEQAVEHVAHIIGQPVVRRHYVVQIVEGPPSRMSLFDLHSERLRRWKLSYELAKFHYAVFVVLCAKMGHARDLVVGERAAERLAIHDLTYRALNQVWPAQTHER